MHVCIRTFRFLGIVDLYMFVIRMRHAVVQPCNVCQIEQYVFLYTFYTVKQLHTPPVTKLIFCFYFPATGVRQQ